MKEVKIRIESPEHSELVQKELFRRGYSWSGNDRTFKYKYSSYLYGTSDGRVVFWNIRSYFDNDKSEEIFIPMLPKFYFGIENSLKMLAKLSGPLPQHKKVIFNYPATIVFWNDGTKTIVKCSKDDIFDKEKGYLMAYFQKQTGMTKSQVSKFFKCDEFGDDE